MTMVRIDLPSSSSNNGDFLAGINICCQIFECSLAFAVESIDTSVDYPIVDRILNLILVF